MKRDDTLWKAILEDVFDDFLLFFFGEETQLFDLEKGFEFLDKELEQLFPFGEEFGYPKFVDKLVKVFTKEGEEKWVLVHVEVQGHNDNDFASRMFTYFYRIYDKYKKRVTCIAIFTDNNKSFKPSSFDYDFLGTKINFCYNTYKVIDQQESELRKSNNPFALVILTVLLALQKGKITEDELFGLKLDLHKALWRKQIPTYKTRSILRFIQFYVNFDSPEMSAKFDIESNLITNKHTTMGIEQFLQQKFRNEGIAEGKAIAGRENTVTFVKALLTETDFNNEKIARIVSVPVSFVEEVKRALLSSPN